MIIRVFRVWIKEGCGADWQRLVEEHSIPWLQLQRGCIAYFPGKPTENDGLEFSMTSVWTDIDAIEAAIGENWNKAKLFGDEVRIAERVDVRHYEVFGEITGNGNLANQTVKPLNK